MIKRIIYIAISVCLSLLILLTAVELVTFNMNHHRSSFEKYNIPEATGMDMENLEATMKDILLYFRDGREALDTKAVVKGELREVFGEREVLHMIDVKHLFVAGRRIRTGAVILLISLLLYIISKDRDWTKNISKTLRNNGIGNLILLIILIIMVLTDFNKYFTYFHYIFFTNDLWLLDPSREILIQMLPEEFFQETAIKIMIIYTGTITILAVVGYYLTRKLRSNARFK